jgi:hypothetical protein
VYWEGSSDARKSAPIVLYEDQTVSTTDDRDRTIERLLKGGAAGRNDELEAVSADDCLDAETLAAYAEGTLTLDGRRSADHHLAGCARCQMVLAEIARTAPETAGDTAPRRWRVGAWLVPLTAAAAAIAIWVAVPGTRQSETAQVPATGSIAQPAAVPEAKPDEKSAADRFSVPTSSTSSARVASADAAKIDALAKETEQRREAGARSQRSLADRPVAAAAPKDVPARSDAQQTTASVEAPARNSVVAGQTAGAPAAPPPPPAPAAAPAQTAAQAAAPQETDLARARAARAGAAGRGGAGVVGALQESVTVLPTEAKSPDGTVRLRFLPAGPAAAIERSTDGGSTWVAQPLGLQVTVTGGACPTRDVCWIIGRGGAVLVSAGNEPWRRITFPYAIDLIGVTARDALHATVTASDGRKFTTEDGGANWTPGR